MEVLGYGGIVAWFKASTRFEAKGLGGLTTRGRKSNENDNFWVRLSSECHQQLFGGRRVDRFSLDFRECLMISVDVPLAAQDY